MITGHSTPEEIDSYFTAKIDEYMALTDEMQILRGRDQSAGRQNFLDEWSRYNPNTNQKFVSVQMAVDWMDGQINFMTGRVEANRNR